MSMTDPTADFLTRIRNAIHASHETVLTRSSSVNRELARVLKEQGYIESFAVQAPDAENAGERLEIALRYTEDRRAVISGLRRVSRPGRRTYVGAESIPKSLGGMGTIIVSTSRGVMTGHEARHAGIGGEVMAEVW